MSKIKTYQPLIIIVLVILGISTLLTIYVDNSIEGFMRFFMGVFFLIFGLFKVIDIAGFAKIYKTYDLLAMRLPTWGYVYPFIEITLGILYISGLANEWIHGFAAILLIFGGIGVWRILQKRQGIHCACLGAIIKLPMSKITLIEDFGMGIMALVMLTMNLY